MSQNSINHRKMVIDDREAILLKQLEELKKEREIIEIEQNEFNKSMDNLRESLQDPNNIILGINKKSRFLADVTREYFGVDSTITDDTMLDILKDKLQNIKNEEQIMSGRDIMKEVNEEESKYRGKNPLMNLNGFNFTECNSYVSSDSSCVFRRKTKSPVFTYTVINGKVTKMSDGTNKEETSKYFNQWKLSDFIDDKTAKRFLACNQQTGEPFEDTINTLNPNIIILRMKDGKHNIITPYDNSMDVIVQSEDIINGVAKYMTQKQYMSALLVCMRLYFGERFTNYFSYMFSKFESAPVEALQESPTKQNYLIYKYFRAYKSAMKIKAYIAKSASGKFIYVSGGWDLKKKTINKYVKCVLDALFSEEEVTEFLNAVEFYGVFDEVSQGSYERYKDNYLKTF